MAKTLRDDRINKITYISLGGAVAVIILFIILFNIFNGNKKNDNLQINENNSAESITEEANSSIGKTVDEAQNNEEKDVNNENNVQVQVNDETKVQGELSQELSNVENLDNIQDVANTSNEITSANSASDDANVKEETKDPTFTMPVEGEIVKHFGKEKLIYSETLKEWTTHLGIDIKADKTTIVKASADGSVKSIKNDPRYGLTIVVEHQNGFTTVYSNLLSAEFVVEGENVKSGQTLGTVGNSATFEILDDSHLHFEILKDGNSIDPEMYIK